ncbi:hypothetical protein BJV77DRAFT_1036439 [Russula vinacea]|nr:hypothetical protein BJV77DRAFT_1036439 [Russula vinacea]
MCNGWQSSVRHGRSDVSILSALKTFHLIAAGHDSRTLGRASVSGSEIHYHRL